MSVPYCIFAAIKIVTNKKIAMAKKDTIDFEAIKEMHPASFKTLEDIANLGRDYCNGDGVNQNYEIGRTLLEKSAELEYVASRLCCIHKLK
jgi:TPR repeat protein